MSKMMNKPKTRDELKGIITERLMRGETDLNDIDTSLITDMSYLIYWEVSKYSFNVENWDTRNVRNMRNMFYGCPNFNSDLSKWNTEKVESMSFMFHGCSSFNQNLSMWDTGRVKDTSFMFGNCEKFNQDISSWNIKEVTNMEAMFWNCTGFNQDLSKWNLRGKKCFNTFFYCPIKDKWKPKYSNLYEYEEDTL